MDNLINDLNQEPIVNHILYVYSLYKENFFCLTWCVLT